MRIWIALFALLVIPVPASASVFTGLGTWIDIFDTKLVANPATAVATAKAQGVRTIYVETANSSSAHDVMAPDSLRQLVAQAHAAGIKVVVWYLPTLKHVARDRRRLIAATTFAAPEHVDGLAFDIESSAVKNVTVRNRRLLQLFRSVLRAVPAWMPVASIIPSPPGMASLPKYWPGFPYRELSALSDAWLPMCYSTYHVKKSKEIAAYTHQCVQMIRAATPNAPLPIHVIGGLAAGLSRARTQAFAAQVKADRASGASLYDLSTTSAGNWRGLHAAGW
jgi:hypothetical protein